MTVIPFSSPSCKRSVLLVSNFSKKIQRWLPICHQLDSTWMMWKLNSTRRMIMFLSCRPRARIKSVMRFDLYLWKSKLFPWFFFQNESSTKLSAELDEERTQCSKLQQENSELEADLLSGRRELDHFKIELANAHDRISALRSDCAQLQASYPNQTEYLMNDSQSSIQYASTLEKRFDDLQIELETAVRLRFWHKIRLLAHSFINLIF